MSHATDVLKDEHRVIERVLAALERAARRLDAGETIDPTFFLQAAEFIKGFADGCHHMKEEGVLFPAMREAGIPAEGGPIAMMLEEHEEGRAFVASMRAAAERLAGGEAGAARDVARAALGYASLLRLHIQKEDNALFPMADQVIRGAAQTRLAEEIERVEREETGQGVHERFLALAETLERQAAS